MNKKFSCFVTGTDTETGKTLVSTAILYGLAQQGVKAAGVKAVAAGAVQRDGVWHNDDADLLAAASGVVLPAEIATPYLLHEATAPHIAAQLQHVSIDLAHIGHCYMKALAAADAVVVEGVGGFRVPLSDRLDTADLAQQLGLPVIMVVGLRLGCLNHALLTAEAITARGLTLAGWVANVVDVGMPYGVDNIAALTQRLRAPLLGCIPRLTAPLASAAAGYLDFSCLPGWPGKHVQ